MTNSGCIEQADAEIVECGLIKFGILPPFFAFRAFVLAHPAWYPTLDVVTRGAIIAFGRRMLDSDAFSLAALPTRPEVAA